MITGGYYEPFETINNNSKYQELIKTYINKQPILIENFISAYVLYNKDNTYNEYLQTYTTSKQNLDTQNAEMFSIINKLQNNINELNIIISKLDNNIHKNLGSNTIMAKKLYSLDGINNSSQLLIDNSKEMYKDQYINNITKVIGIFILFFLFFIFFVKSQTNLKT